MASRYCAKCGREIAEGKRFCGGCGQAIPMGSSPAQPEFMTAPEAQTRSCARCGAALAPGKRFCKQCGEPVSEFAPISESANAALPEQAIAQSDLTRAHCGAAVAAGKRFCKQCGQPVDSTAIVAVAAPVLKGQSDITAAASVVADLPAAMPVSTLTNEPDVALPIQDVPPGGWTPIHEPTGPGSQQPPSPPLAATAIASTEPEPEPPRQSKAKLGLAIGIAAAVVLAAASVLAWHLHSHRGVSTAAQSSVEPQQSTATPPSIIPSAKNTQAQEPRPAPGIPEQAASSEPKSQSDSGMMTEPGAPSTKTPQSVIRQPESTTPPPKIATTPPSPPPSTAPRSGGLHYQGPPVPHNGIVVFDHLPQARLRFTFDHQAWSLTIKPNSDGTKKVTLISQTPGYQTSCDLGWEIVD